MSAPTTPDGALPDAARRVHRALLLAYVERGAVPPAAQLAARAGVAATELRERLRELQAADYVALDAGLPTCLYPFSARPTPHVVNIDGAPRHAMCAIDALGIAAMLDHRLAIEARCAVCDTSIAVTVRPGVIVDLTPSTTLVAARRDEDEPAFAACCPFTVFVCGQEHGAEFARRTGGVQILSPATALARAEEIFGGLLADALPACRPRGKAWSGNSAPAPVLYTQAECADSARVRAWLTARGISFTERDAGSDREAAAALAATGTFATPLLVAGDRQLLGYQPEIMATLFGEW